MGVEGEGENYNLICCVPVIVKSGDQGSVFIDAIDIEEEQEGGGCGDHAVVRSIAGESPAAGMNAQLMAVSTSSL